MDQNNGTNGSNGSSYQRVVDEITKLHATAMSIPFEDQIGFFRENMAEMALAMMRQDRKIHAYFKYPRYSREDRIGIDFLVFVSPPQRNAKSIRVSVLGPKYADKEKDVHPKVDFVLPVSVKEDTVTSVIKKITEYIEKEMSVSA
jgi:hypothetical protein